MDEDPLAARQTLSCHPNCAIQILFNVAASVLFKPLQSPRAVRPKYLASRNLFPANSYWKI